MYSPPHRSVAASGMIDVLSVWVQLATVSVASCCTCLQGSAVGAKCRTVWCACRWIAFVEAAQNGTADQAKEAYQRFLLELANMELLVSRLL